MTITGTTSLHSADRKGLTESHSPDSLIFNFFSGKSAGPKLNGSEPFEIGDRTKTSYRDCPLSARNKRTMATSTLAGIRPFVRSSILLFLLVAVFGSSPLLRAETASIPLKELPPNTRYAIWGDSITEVTLYPKFTEAYLLACAGRKDIDVCTFGHSGETAGGLQSRQSDLEAFHPTLVSIFWGMNDTQYTPYTDEKGSNFDKTTRANLALLDAKGIKGKLVMAPSYVDGAFSSDSKTSADAISQNTTLGHFRDFARAAAFDNGAAFSDTYNRMKDAYTAAEKVLGPTYAMGVHVSPNGALMIAHELIKTLGCDGNIGTIDVDMQGKVQASAGHTVVSFSNGAVVLDSSKYPFCYNYDPYISQGPIGIDSILPYMPFSQELNRFTLKVTNLGAPSASVTWGSETKQFTSDQLAAGINLAEQFDHTPFDSTFAKVMSAVQNKQDYETFMIKGTANYNGNDNGGNVDTNMIAVESEKDAALKALIAPVPPVITGTMMVYPAVGQPFTYQISALGSPTSFTAANLPKGLTLDEKSGQITGTPTDPGVSTVALSATNAAGSTSTTLTLTIAAPTPPYPGITSAKTADATTGAAFSYQIAATNNPTHYFAWTQSDKGTEPPVSSLPPGITYDSKSGLISGTPTKAGAYTIQIAAMNDAGVSPASFVLTVKDK
jgi:hypothetical protein